MISYILHHRRKMAVLLIAVTAWAFWGLSKAKFEFYRAIVLPDNDPAMLANNAMRDYFGGQQSVIFVVESENIYQGAGLKAVKSLTADLAELTGVESAQDVASLATIQEIASDHNGLSVRTLVDDESDLEARYRASPFYNPHLVSADGKAALVIATLGERVYPDPSISTPEFMAAHPKEVEALLKKYNVNGVRVAAIGSQLVLAEGEHKLRNEIIVLASIAFLFILIVFYLSFKSVAITLLAALSLLVALIWTLGTMGHVGAPLSTTTVYLVIVIIAVGSSYAIHVISSVKEAWEKEVSRGVAAKNAIYEISLPLLTVSVTSALSSVSLLTFDAPDIRELGVFQALGVTLAYLNAYFVLPAVTFVLLVRHRRKKIQSGTLHNTISSAQRKDTNSVGAVAGRILQSISTASLRWPLGSWIFVLILCVLSYLGASRVNANFVLEKTVPSRSLPAAGYARILEKFGDFRLASIVVRTVNEESLLTPKGLSFIRGAENTLKNIEGVKALPGLNTALTTVAKHAFDDDGNLNSQERIDQALMLVGKRKLRKVIDASGSRALIHVALDTSDPKVTNDAISKIQSNLQKLPPGYAVFIGGAPIVVNSLNRYMVVNKIQSIIMCIFIVFILCSLVYSSLRLGLISILPAVLSVLLTFGFMGFLGIDLDMGTATITTIAIGVGTDFAVHLLLHFRSELARLKILPGVNASFTSKQYAEVILKTSKHFGPVVFFDASSNIFGFMPLVFSSFPPVRIAGGLLIVNQVIVLLVTFILLPLLILMFRPDFPKPITEGLDSELSDRLV